MKTILITGGAGFVGSNLAILSKKQFGENSRIISFDNLKRRGSELNLSRLKENGVEFIHGDIRIIEDLESVGKMDAILECSAEPSVLAGYDESPAYLIQTNLNGTINCLEIARRRRADFIFLSTSRVYPIKTINELKYLEKPDRFELASGQTCPGVSDKGFSEKFPLEGTRSLYGATKLCSEYIIKEYVEMYGIRAVINRCGVLTGPWQMGKTDQGVVAMWVAKHEYGGELDYFGYGGEGKQVRDILSVDDLFNLLAIQIDHIDDHNGEIYNVGGGAETSVSLKELTRLCETATGEKIHISSVTENRQADIPYYVTDHSRVTEATGWEPQKKPFDIVMEITEWIKSHREKLKKIFT